MINFTAAKKRIRKVRKWEDHIASVIHKFLFLTFGFVCLFMLLISILILYPEVSMLGEYFFSNRWSKTTGKISEHVVLKERVYRSRPTGKYWGSYGYSFQVENETYTSDRIDFNRINPPPISSFSEKEAKDFLEQHFPINQEVEVYYNPSNPQRSVLFRRYEYDSGKYQAGCFWGILPILLLLIGFYKYRKSLVNEIEKSKG